ncbi:hypothetical protein OG21DRAFT_1469530 [Imleria badia]|nr:hypothetical protein OG21DRAFT_1469530 [Imleria badia]
MTFNTEIIIFDTSEASRENPESQVVTNALKPTLLAEGANTPAYYGLQIENPSTGYIIIHWDSHEIHQAFGNHPSFPAIHEAFKPSLGCNRATYDVEFSAPTVAALEKPVTEIPVSSLKAPENRDAVVDILTKISEASENILVFGQTRQDENKYIVIGGWPTVEVHWETAAKPEFAAALTKLYSLVNKEHLYHTGLSRYWP